MANHAGVIVGQIQNYVSSVLAYKHAKIHVDNRNRDNKATVLIEEGFRAKCGLTCMWERCLLLPKSNQWKR